MLSADPRRHSTDWDGPLGEKPGVLRRRWQDIREGLPVGALCVGVDGCNVLQNRTQNQPQEDQVHGLHARFHIGEVG